jgi:hypothetical protein
MVAVTQRGTRASAAAFHRKRQARSTSMSSHALPLNALCATKSLPGRIFFCEGSDRRRNLTRVAIFAISGR